MKETKKIEELKKEAEQSIERFSKELQLLNQRQNLVTQEIFRLAGEVRGYEKLLKKDEEPKEEKKDEQK